MSHELTTALQNLLNCQFQAGRALGLYEAALATEASKAPEPQPNYTSEPEPFDKCEPIKQIAAE